MTINNPFKHLRTLGICCAVALSAIACQSTAADTSANSSSPKPAVSDPATARSLWVWDAGVITDRADQQELLDFIQAHQISELFLDLGDFDDAEKRPETHRKHVTAKALGSFLERFHAAGIKVQALGGDPHFALRERHQDALDQMKAVLDYNAGTSAKRRLDGFQWDVEPYILAGFKTDQHHSILVQYLEFVNASAVMVKKSAHPTQFNLGFAVPFWFDKAEQGVTWKDKKQPVVFSVMDILSMLPRSYIAIMAYRDHATGSNGSIGVSQAEIDYAVAHDSNTGIWVGVETGDVQPASITFFGKPNEDLENSLREINAAFHAIPNYCGVAIHHWESYRKLVQE